jgi:rhodanese-related sulfurtransferase
MNLSPARLNETEAALLEAARTAMTIPEGNNVVKPADLNERLDDYFVLDVRDAETFAKGHIEGAVNVPYLEMGGYIDQLPRDKTIAIPASSPHRQWPC